MISCSITCHDAFSFGTFTHHLLQRSEVIRKKLVRISHGIFWNNLTFYRSERKLVITLQFFLHRMLFNYILAGIFIGSLVKIFAGKVARGNSVQTGTNFPAKSLSIYMKFFSWLFFINLIEIITYKTNKILCWIWNLWFIEHIYRK